MPQNLCAFWAKKRRHRAEAGAIIHNFDTMQVPDFTKRVYNQLATILLKTAVKVKVNC
jgi:hypothetical protein